MISPYVRRLRLGRELEALRDGLGLTTEQLAKEAGISRYKVSRLENGHIRPDLAEVDRLLRALEVSDERWEILYAIARDAGERGWWEAPSLTGMGDRQARQADLEAGADSIRSYHQTFVPGLLQTREYMEALSEFDDMTIAGVKPAKAPMMIEGRVGRQRMLSRTAGPTYEAIVDETVLLRPSAPEPILARQLRDMSILAERNPRMSVRILPVRARIDRYSVPRSGFSLFTYPDQRDPVVVAVETVAQDLILTDSGEIAQYERLYDRLGRAALSVEDSAGLLAEAANEMEGDTP